MSCVLKVGDILKLHEIRERLDAMAKHGDTIEKYSQEAWDELPRMPYKELPASLQKTVRERFTANTLFDFLRTCYVPLEAEEIIKDVVTRGGLTVSKETDPHQYTSFETITAGISDDDMGSILIKTRNTAIYTVENETPGNPVPFLYGNHATEAFENAIEAYREALEAKQRKKEEQEQYEKEKEKAKKEGTKLPQKPQRTKGAENFVSAGFYQYVISDKAYQHALTTQQNKNAYIALMNPEFFKELDFKNGTVTFNKETAGIIKEHRKGRYEDVQDLDFPLLTQIYTAAVKSNIRHDAFTITVSLPKFFREMGIEVSKGNAPDIMAKLNSFEKCVGIMPGTQTISKLFSIIKLDLKNQTITFAVPYMMELYEKLGEKNHIERKTRKGELIDYRQPYHNTLVHSSIAKERNKTAVELVYLMTTGLLQRGYTPDAQTYRMKDSITQYPERITYSVRFRTLINDAPLLRGRVQSYNDTKDKNKALRRAFEKAYQLMDKKTDAGEWFIDLECNRIIPTMTTLDDELIFTHNGKNGDYRPKK